MYSLVQSVRVRGSAGEPLPTVFKGLEATGTQFLRSQLCLVCSGPGTGKSIFALTVALRSGVPTLYFSADSDAFVQATRALAVLTNRTVEESAKLVMHDDLGADASMLSNYPIRFRYSASPSLDDIERSMEAYREVYGDFPALVVVDNLTNVRGVSTEDDPFSGLEALMDYLHTMARDSGACVFALHHVTGGYNDAEKPIPLSGVKGQITRVPEMVLTMHKKAGDDWSPDTLCVSTVKNRGGRADPSGNTFAELEFNGDRMAITDIERMP